MSPTTDNLAPLLQLYGVTSNFNVYSPSIAKYDNKIPMVHLTAEEPPWDPSTEEYSEHETQMTNY